MLSPSVWLSRTWRHQKRFIKLGFSAFAGDEAQNWLNLKNGSTVIGLFQGMFDKNILTFNPGWDSNAAPVTDVTDVRDIQRRLLAEGMQMVNEAD